MAENEKSKAPAPKPGPRRGHRAAESLEGKGAPGDMSGVFTSTEKPGASEGDMSHLTGRNERDMPKK